MRTPVIRSLDESGSRIYICRFVPAVGFNPFFQSIRPLIMQPLQIQAIKNANELSIQIVRLKSAAYFWKTARRAVVSRCDVTGNRHFPQWKFHLASPADVVVIGGIGSAGRYYLA